MLKKFGELGLSPQLLKTVEEMGFENPTEIQSQAIPLLLTEERDMIGLAQTGTGKTAAFGLPLLELIDAGNRNTQALILSPTRELAQQIANQLQEFSKYIDRLNVVCVYGGANISQQIKQLQRGVQIIIATPGRLIDLMGRGAVRLNQLEYLVLDEADEMLNMGFKDELDRILEDTPEEKLTWLFSATMPKEIRRIIKRYMDDPAEIQVNQQGIVNQNIEHRFAVLKASDKAEALRRLLDFDADMYGVVFCRTKRDTQKVAEDLVESGYSAEPLHGDLSQSQRDAAMKRFRAKNLQLLIATDVAARGIDVNDLTHVVHFALPDDPEFYTHRSGRTARAGKKGVSLALITKAELRRIKFLESRLKIQFEKASIPSLKDVTINRISHWAAKIAEEAIDDKIDSEAFNTAVSMLGDFNKEELIQKLVTKELHRISSKTSLKDLNQSAEGGGERRERGSRGPKSRDESMRRYFINIGEMDGFNKSGILRLICDESGVPGTKVGRISLDRKHSYVDIDQSEGMKVQNAFKGFVLEGREIRLNRDDSGGSRDRRGGGNRNNKKKGGKKNKKRFR